MLSSLEIFELAKVWMSRQANIQFAVAYGSITTPNFGNQSDVDFAIAGSSKFSFNDILNWKVELEQVTHRSVDLIDLNTVRVVRFFKKRSPKDFQFFPATRPSRKNFSSACGTTKPIFNHL